MGSEEADGAGLVWVQNVPVLVSYHQVQIQVPGGWAGRNVECSLSGARYTARTVLSGSAEPDTN